METTTVTMNMDDLMESNYEIVSLYLIDKDEEYILTHQPGYVYGHDEWICVRSTIEEIFVSFDTIVEAEVIISS